MSIDNLQQYVRKMECLQIDKAHGDAPHKPLLLLAVIELIEQGQICENRIYFSPALAETVMKYWVEVTDRRFNIAMPFFHLKSDKFWHLHPNPGYKKVLEGARQIRSISRIQEVIAYASLDDDFFVLLTDADNREIIRQTLISTYFSNFQQAIESLIAERQQIGEYGQLLIHEVEHPFSFQRPTAPTSKEEPIRSAGFRKAIMRLYKYTCAVCRLCIITTDGESATEAAHIIPFRISQNDDVRNGISLCKLHHWAFDTGLISLNTTYRVVVSRLIVEQGPMEWRLTKLRGKSILLPEHDQLYPAQDALDWHREKRLRR